ncbi:MAG: hypothetical protein HFJ53_08740 [Clostridia bacterium]|nr:hypothetical protein [Clostridia bacterium]
MELKTKYQYTYFTYPYIIEEDKYEKYLLKLLKDKKIKIKFFEKERDLEIYSYFLPKIKEFMFQGFEFTKQKIRSFEELTKQMQAVTLSKYPSVMFSYNLEQDIQGKVGEENGIFFKIQKLELICFQTGICFLVIKTYIEESNKFSDVLNFNYKFRDIHSELKELKEYENIRLQSTTFEDVKKLNEIIKDITGDEKLSKDLNIDTNRFLTYAYTCIEQKDWNESKSFKNIEFEFLKYLNLNPSSCKSNFEKKNIQTFSKWKFIKLGMTKEGTMLMASGIDTYNYTKLPHLYENQYFYTYILVQYQKIYLNKIEQELKEKSTANQAREKFIKFTKDLWVQEITNDDTGTNLYKKYKIASEIDKKYIAIKNKFDIAYKELNLEKESKINKIILIVLVISLALNIINFIALMKLN